MLPLSLPDTGQTGPLSEPYIVEFQQSSGSPSYDFSMTPDRHTLSVNLSDSDQTHDYAESGSPPDNKRYRPDVYRINTALFVSISWQFLYATNLLVAYELTLGSRDAPLIAPPCSWLPVEAVVSVGWLLQSYWNPDLPLFNPIARQSTSMLTRGNPPYTAITITFSSGDNQQQQQQHQQYQSSESYGQQAPLISTHSAGSISGTLYSGSGGGDEDPEQHQHTLDLNCYFNFCHGVCQHRPSFDSTEFAESPLNFTEISIGHTGDMLQQSFLSDLLNRHCHSCIGHFNSVSATDSQVEPIFETLNNLFDTEILGYGQSSQLQTQNMDDKLFNSFSLSEWAASDGVNYTTDASVSLNDDVQISGNLPSTDNDFLVINGSPSAQCLLEQHEVFLTMGHSETQQTTTESSLLDQRQPHLYQTATLTSLLDQKGNNRTRQSTCKVNVIGEDGQHWPCGKVCKDNQALSKHKRKDHSGQQTCGVTVIGEDGQPRPCGKVSKNTKALSSHKSRDHSGQKTCYVTVTGEDGQLRPCGRVLMSARGLTDHKIKDHSKQKTCVMTVIREDGSPKPCGVICKNAKSYYDHKRFAHSGPKTCDLPVVGKDGQPQPCGKICNNAQALSIHKLRTHSGKKTCEVKIVAEDGQLQPCGKACKNAGALNEHKRAHRKRKPVDVKPDNDLSRQETKVNK
ncbi:hypothetical protein [Endozoicomonas sp. ALD040]|uniref:hypothetical protein n=1 Tax=unclassified Endozoicomonas TaxID=2644528 RepID=UPI003BB1FE19